MPSQFYFDVLYPLQDDILTISRSLETGFYLTAGTAISRGYLNHRFSDDLYFFVNDHPNFTLWSGRIISALQADQRWHIEIIQREDCYA